MFHISKKSKKSQARLGTLKTKHGSIKTPFFMPIATKGAVKSLTSGDIRQLRAQIILSNTYHQMLQPGDKILKKIGGLHKFMDWDKPILTDSGGFQIFSLANIRKIEPKGVKFRSHINGDEFFLTPKKSLDIQKAIGSDIRMVLDVCPSYKSNYKQLLNAVELTSKWAEASLKYRDKKSLLFGITQGATNKNLRLKSAKELSEMDFSGYAIGGLAVGEPYDKALEVLEYTIPVFPQDKPHYLMGVGYPEQMIEAVKRGIDMFDCVIPTREARHGRIYLFCDPGHPLSHSKLSEESIFDYKKVSIRNARFCEDFSPINPNSKLKELRTYTKAYLNHLFKTGEPLSIRLATLNNVEFYLEFLSRIRLSIKKGNL